MAGYDAKINILIQNQDKLKKVYDDLDQIQEKITRISGQKIPQINIEINRSRVDAQLALISQQFRRRDYRLNVNDTAIKTATVNAKKLQDKLTDLTSRKHIVEVEYVEKRKQSITGAEIGKRAQAAKGSGLSQELKDILAAGEAAVGGLASSDKITALLSKVSKKSKESGGFNVPGLLEVIKSLGGAPLQGAKRAQLVKQAQELIQSVDKEIIDAVYERLIDLKMELKPIRKSGLTTSFGPQAARSTANMQDIIDRIAFATTRPGTAQGMLRKIPEKFITTDIADLASRQMRYFEQIPLAKQTYKEGKYFDPLLKAIAEAFAKYTRGISPMNPWYGKPGTGIEKILSQQLPTRPIGLLPPAGGTSGSRINREMLSGLQPLTAPRLGLAEDLRYLRSIQRYIRMANEALGTETEALIRASGQMPLGSSALREGRLLPPAGGTGGTFGGGGGGFGGGGAGSGDGGGFNIPPFGPGTRAADRRRRIRVGRRRQRAFRRAGSEGLIGGAFPLLFGQGLGASVGGGLGGAVGGFAGGGLGFGLSLVGTALGTALDTAVQSAKELGAALRKPVENFDKLVESSFFSSRALEDQIKKTIEYGDAASASAMIQEEAIRKFGVNGVKNLAYLESESDKLNRAWAELGQSIQALIAGPLGSLLRAIAKPIEKSVAISRAQNVASQLNATQQKQFRQELVSAIPDRRGGLPGNIQSAISLFGNLEPEQLKKITEKWEPILLKGKIKIDQKQIDESTLNALQKQLEGIDIAKGITDQIRSAAREQQDLDKQRADLVRSYEESIANIRKQVEDEIARRRFSILEKENQLLDLQGQNRIKQLQNANQIIIARAGAGQRPEVEDAAKQAASIVAQFTEEQVSAEEEAAKIKRDAALDARKFDFEAATFKANIEKEVSRLNIETARQVAQINEQVRRRNEETDRKRFEIEKQIAQIGLRKFIGEVSANIENIKKQIEIAKAGGLGEMSPGVVAGRNQIASYQAQINEYNKTISEIEKMRAPAPLRGVGAVGGGSVPTTQISALVSEEQGKIRAITEELTKATRLNAEQSIITFKNKLIDLSKAFNAPITAIATAMDDENQKNIRYTQLLSQGVKGVTAEKIIQIEQERELAKAKYNSAIAELEIQKNAEGVNAGTRAVIESQIVEYQNLRDALDGATAQLAQRAIESSRGEEVRGFINSSIESLNNLETVAIRVSQGIGDAVGGAMNEGINGLIDGTMTAQEVFANFLKNVSQILMQEATKMIATYIAIGLAKQFAGLFGGGVGTTKAETNAQFMDRAFSTGAFNNVPSIGGYANGGMFSSNGIVPFAMGGAFTNSIVTAPTLFKFANGGAMGTGVMGEAGPEAVMPLTRGPDGRLGVQASGGGGAVVNGDINITVENTGETLSPAAQKQIAGQVQGIVLATLADQKRGGGMLR